MPSLYDVGLDRNPANHAPLTPLSFLDWSATVFPRRTSIIHGPRRFTWAATRSGGPSMLTPTTNRLARRNRAHSGVNRVPFV